MATSIATLWFNKGHTGFEQVLQELGILQSQEVITLSDKCDKKHIASMSTKRTAEARSHHCRMLKDFDLDEHLAALPRCDIEVLSRRRKELRRDSGSSSGKQGSKVEDSGTESDQGAGSESTEENGVRDWHSGEEEEAGEGGRTSPKKDKRKKGKGAVREEDLPSGLATLADIALSQKEKMQD
ncbi:hypothetical protein ISCGN_005312 [Ixodes scapularis]